MSENPEIKGEEKFSTKGSAGMDRDSADGNGSCESSSMASKPLKCLLEASLMAANRPLSIKQLLALFTDSEEPVDRKAVSAALDELIKDYAERGVQLRKLASGFRFQIHPDFGFLINRLFDERPPRYSRPLLETLSIIAYRQPITRAEIEAIRGVAISPSILKILREREWIKTVGHRDLPGCPELLATTKQFLDYFNLSQLSDLPTLAEFRDEEESNPSLFDEANRVAQEAEGAIQHSADAPSPSEDEDAIKVQREDRDREEESALHALDDAISMTDETVAKTSKSTLKES